MPATLILPPTIRSTTNVMVSMPAERKERMKLLAKIFEFYSTAVLFGSLVLEDGEKVDLDKFHAKVSKSLWDTHFTAEQTKMMETAQFERLFRVRTSASTVCPLIIR